MFVSLSNRLKIWPGNRCITFPENNSEEATANNDPFLRGDKKGRDQTTRHTALNNKKRSGCVRLQMFGAHNGHDDTLHARLCAVTTQNSVHVIKRHETTGHLFGKSLSSLVPSGRVCVCVFGYPTSRYASSQPHFPTRMCVCVFPYIHSAGRMLNDSQRAELVTGRSAVWKSFDRRGKSKLQITHSPKVRRQVLKLLHNQGDFLLHGSDNIQQNITRCIWILMWPTCSSIGPVCQADINIEGWGLEISDGSVSGNTTF